MRTKAKGSTVSSANPTGIDNKGTFGIYIFMIPLNQWVHRIVLIGSLTMLFVQTPETNAQGVINVLPHRGTTLVNHHNDQWPIFDPTGILITEMSLFLDISPMNQINPNGEATVFRTDSLSPVDVANDSHFLLDPSQFTVLQQSESTSIMSATVRFHTPMLLGPINSVVQAVARDGHGATDGTFGTFRASVLTVGGDRLEARSFGSIIPEPNSLHLSLLGLIGFCGTKFYRQCRRTRILQNSPQR